MASIDVPAASDMLRSDGETLFGSFFDQAVASSHAVGGIMFALGHFRCLSFVKVCVCVWTIPARDQECGTCTHVYIYIIYIYISVYDLHSVTCFLLI